MATAIDVTRIFTFLSSAYPNFAPAAANEEYGIPGTLDIYREALADLDYDVLKAAARKCLADCRFFPTIAELRQAAATIVAPPSASGVEAWGLVMREVRRGVGYPLDIPVPCAITDALILRAVDAIGGWKMLQRSTNQEDIAHRARFVEVYETLLERQASDARQMPEVRQIAAARQAEAAALLKQTAARLTAGGGNPRAES